MRTRARVASGLGWLRASLAGGCMLLLGAGCTSDNGALAAEAGLGNDTLAADTLAADTAAADTAAADTAAADTSATDTSAADTSAADASAADTSAADTSAADSGPVSSPDAAAEWEGSFEDSFERAALEAEAFGWRGPLSDNAALKWSLVDNALRVEGNVGSPGSTALTAWPLVLDQHVEVTIHRSDLQGPHFTDVILRMHPTLLAKSFYRVRLYQEHKGFPGEPDRPDDESDPAFGFAGVQIAIFKISDDGNGEAGIVINDAKPATKEPLYCTDCPYVPGVPVDTHLRVIIDLVGTHFDVRVVNPQKPSEVILQAQADDTTATPVTAAGYTGLAHFEGVANFDDFVLTRK